MAHGKLVTVSELQLGDIVDLQFPDNVHSTASVTQIEGGLVSLTRPHLVLSNFTCSAGVLWSLGVEVVKFDIRDPGLVLRIRESDVLKHEARMLEEEAKQKAELTRLREENRKLREARDVSARLTGQLFTKLTAVQDSANLIAVQLAEPVKAGGGS